MPGCGAGAVTVEGQRPLSGAPGWGPHLVIRLGEVVKAGDVVQEEMELRRHVLQEHPVLILLLDHPHLLLEGRGHRR